MLVPAFLTAIVIAGALEGGGRRAILARLEPFRLTLYTFGALAVAGAAWSFMRGSDVLGAHGHWLHVFDLLSLPHWLLVYLHRRARPVRRHRPVRSICAHVRARSATRLAGSPRARRGRDRGLMLYGWSPDRHVLDPAAGDPAVHGRRYVFYVVPLVLLVFLLWISLGAPRPGRLALAAGAVAFVAPAAVSFADFLNGRAWGVSSSTVALVPWGLLKPLLGAHGQLLAVVMAFSGVAVALFLLVKPKHAYLLRLVVILNFLFITLFVLAANTVVAAKANARWVSSRPQFGRQIGCARRQRDRDLGRARGWPSDTQGLGPLRSALFETQLTNTSVVRIYAYDDGSTSFPSCIRSPVRRFEAPKGCWVKQARRSRPTTPSSDRNSRWPVPRSLRTPSSGLLLVKLAGSGPR